MSSYKSLLEQRAQLEQKIQEARENEVKTAVDKIHQLIADFELSQNDIFPARKSGKIKAQSGKVAAKYKNPETGETWTGRGKAPNWIKDRQRDLFLIKQ